MIRFKQKPAAPHAKRCMPRASVTRKIADTIREMGFSGEDMTSEAFERRGFSRAVVEGCGEDARALARRLSVRQIA